MKTFQAETFFLIQTNKDAEFNLDKSNLLQILLLFVSYYTIGIGDRRITEPPIVKTIFIVHKKLRTVRTSFLHIFPLSGKNTKKNE